MYFLELLRELGGEPDDPHAAAGLVEVLVEGQELADAGARDGGDLGEIEVGVAETRVLGELGELGAELGSAGVSIGPMMVTRTRSCSISMSMSMSAPPSFHPARKVLPQ